MKTVDAGPLLTDEEFAAMRQVVARRGDDVKDGALMMTLREKGYLRHELEEGWIITIEGHRAFIRTLSSTF